MFLIRVIPCKKWLGHEILTAHIISAAENLIKYIFYGPEIGVQSRTKLARVQFRQKILLLVKTTKLTGNAISCSEN